MIRRNGCSYCTTKRLARQTWIWQLIFVRAVLHPVVDGTIGAQALERRGCCGQACLYSFQNNCGKQRTAQPTAGDSTLDERWRLGRTLGGHAPGHQTRDREQMSRLLTALGVTPPDLDGWSYGEAREALVLQAARTQSD